jgi:hypothetical protein
MKKGASVSNDLEQKIHSGSAPIPRALLFVRFLLSNIVNSPSQPICFAVRFFPLQVFYRDEMVHQERISEMVAKAERCN